MSWIQTASGRAVDLLEPTPRSIEIEDIAYALAHTPRFAGAASEFYSVAQHSVTLSRVAPTIALARAALLHDASEAYLGDVASPLKRLLPRYQESESAFMQVISDKFAVPMDDFAHPWLLRADREICVSEARALLVRGERPWPDPVTPLAGIVISPKNADAAERSFKLAFRSLWRTR